MDQEIIQKRSFLTNILISLAIYSAAFAQPLFSSLGNSATFFVAHNSETAHILSFVFSVVFIIPIVIIVIGFSLRKFLYRGENLFFNFVFCLLGFFFGLVLFQDLLQFNPYFTLLGAALFGLILCVLINKITLVRTIVTFSSIALPLSAVMFLIFSQASEVVWNKLVKGNQQGSIKSNIPIVFVIFDEFNPVGLLDDKNDIDKVRFPNFHKLAQTSTWYPNASSMHVQSFKAVPSILTGNIPPDDDPLPSEKAYPENIFTFLHDSSEFNVVETFTALCPSNRCASDSQSDTFNKNEFFRDINVIVKHIFYPKKWAETYLPVLDSGWKNFGVQKIGESKDESQEILAEKRRKNFHKNDLYNEFENFIDEIDESKSLNFIHTVLPHTPWIYLPDGKNYQHDDIGPLWETQTKADEAYHRYLMQLGAMDKLLGKLLEQLDQKKIFDESFIVVTADHGLIFRDDVTKRGVNPKKAPVSIKSTAVRIPLFIKFPNQSTAKTDKRFVQNIDVLPTLLDVLSGGTSNINFDGQSLIGDKYNERETIRFVIRGQERNYLAKDILGEKSVLNRLEKYGHSSPLKDLKIRDKHSDLFLENYANLSAVSKPSILSPIIEFIPKDYSEVKIEGSFLPALFDAQIEFATNSSKDFHVVILLNDEIAAIVPTTGDGQTRRVRTLLPAGLFVEGFNDLKAYLVSLNEKAEREINTVEIRRNEFIIEDDKMLRLGSKEGYKIENIPAGSLILSENNRKVEVNGWAADIKGHSCANKVLFFNEGEFLAWTETGLPTRALAKREKTKALETCRFKIILDDLDLLKSNSFVGYGFYENGRVLTVPATR